MNDSLLTDDALALKILLDSPVYVLKQDFIALSSNQEITSEPTSNEEKTPFKGGFAKKILFIISSDNLKLSDNDWDLFNKTTAALKLSIEDIAIIENETDAPIKDLSSIINELNPNKTIVFGKVNSTIILDKLSILNCETLKSLSENKDLKIQWWNSLKTYLS
jgi:hypothetical protein